MHRHHLHPTVLQRAVKAAMREDRERGKVLIRIGR